MEIIIGIAIVSIAGFVQGLTSFGFALISVPFFIIIIPLKETVPIVVFLSLCTNIFIICNCIKEIKIKKIWLLILPSVIFAPIGVYSLKFINSDYLKIFFGIIIIIFSVLLIFKKSFPIKNEKIGYTLTGSLSGFLNGSLSLSGPPVVLFLSNQGIKKNSFRANITFYSIILNSITIGTYLANGLLDKIIFEKILYLIPAMLLGVFTGIKISKKLNEALFKKITLILLILTGIWTLINAVKNIKG
jgi:uncharacterized membrane protein YfcA